MVRAHKDELLEALMGDPLEGFGWEARTALFRQALRWLDGKVEKMGPKDSPMERTVISALCQQDVADPLNAAWRVGDFEEFRAALREYVRAGLHAAKSNVDRCNTKSSAAVTAHQSTRTIKERRKEDGAQGAGGRGLDVLDG
jgi:hypothetical protein